MNTSKFILLLTTLVIITLSVACEKTDEPKCTMEEPLALRFLLDGELQTYTTTIGAWGTEIENEIETETIDGEEVEREQREERIAATLEGFREGELAFHFRKDQKITVEDFLAIKDQEIPFGNDFTQEVYAQFSTLEQLEYTTTDSESGETLTIPFTATPTSISGTAMITSIQANDLNITGCEGDPKGEGQFVKIGGTFNCNIRDVFYDRDSMVIATNRIVDEGEFSLLYKILY